MTTYSAPSYLTSRIYPVQTIESFAGAGVKWLNAPFYFETEGFHDYGPSLLSGDLQSALYEYNNYPPESFYGDGVLMAATGTLTPGLYEYNNYPPESFYGDGVAFTGGSGPTTALIEYSNYPPENFYAHGVTLTAGTLV